MGYQAVIDRNYISSPHNNHTPKQNISYPIMFLQIVIPTYNRAKYLRKNLEELSYIINRLNLGNEISIFISDNCSTDDTAVAVKDFISRSNIDITYVRQSTNIGAAANLIYVIAESKADYILILGDDDYLDERYIVKAIDLIKSDDTISCILPAFKGIDEEGNIIPGSGRDLNRPEQSWPKGFYNLYINNVKAHQLSGILIKNIGIKDALAKAAINNLYPQIFVTGYACLRGKTIHLPQYPVRVTQTQKKDWNYDRTGLLGDVFENYSKLGLSQLQRYKCEKRFTKLQSWRILHNKRKPLKQIADIFALSFHKNTSVPGHFVFPFYITAIWLGHLLKAGIHRSR